MLNETYLDCGKRMEKSINLLREDLATLKAGRATPALLANIRADYYGTPTAVNQMANISAPEPRLLVIQPWDPKSIVDIEKAILKSDLGITPSNDGKIIRLAVPQLTEERRKELVKVIKKKGEEEKVAIRNIRRDCNDKIKGFEKDKQISEDESKKGLDEIQKITDKYIVIVDKIIAEKEKEVMEV
jgi:ribosome recycling factor